MKPEQSSVSLVLLGRFKPAEFELRRLTELKALPKSDLEGAQYEALLRDQAVSFLLPWGKLTVLTEKLQMDVTQVPYVRGADLVLRLMHEVAPASTVLKFGINLTSHYRFVSIPDRDKFASRLVPPAGWGKFGQRVEATFSLEGRKHGGLTIVTLRDANPPDRSGGWIDVNVQPSPLVPNDLGVAVGINDHFELSAEEVDRFMAQDRAVSEHLLGMLEKSFDASLQRSFEIADSVMGA